MEKIKVLFVCMGNICRSPTAEGVFTKLVADQHLSEHFQIDSAGTHAEFHSDEAPDLRAQKAASERGILISHLRARKVTMRDFDEFDFLLVMDDDNYQTLMQFCPTAQQSKVQYFLDYAPDYKEREVPDPYYGGRHGFERVLNMIEAASEGFLSELKKTKRIG